jgi:glycosyltransferase involved in cell wall biosynthesis
LDEGLYTPPQVSVGPRVTILMPVYNGQRYVDEAIASVVGQDYPDFEFVIVDDGSTDGTPAILEQWAGRDSRIVLVRSPRNEGISAALNRGLAVARGEYVARQDADDLCVRRRLAQQVAVLDADPGVQLVSAGYELMESDGRRRRVLMRDEAPELVEYLLHFSNFIGGHGQVMFRRATVAEAGNYDVAYPYSQDYDLWSKLMRRGRCVVLPIIGMRHRMHEHRVSRRTRWRSAGRTWRCCCSASYRTRRSAPWRRSGATPASAGWLAARTACSRRRTGTSRPRTCRAVTVGARACTRRGSG